MGGSIVDHRRAKGVSFIELAKLLKALRRKQPLGNLSPDAEALLDDHLLPSEWYPFPPVIELIQVTFRLVLKHSEESGLQMGVLGGTNALTSYHKMFVKPGDPLASLMAMRHSWRLYFDFGHLSATQEGKRAVRFELTGYPDMPAAHGPMIVGWHRSAGFVAGAATTRGQIVEAPWRGGKKLVHRVEF